ncbi:MAG TPA: hypothetical protein VJ869_10445 [Sphaerochaeta sp.]|jgi:CheY-like chemotaxis protein|nr:hypothetical protein [Sphaerochaeta sp.]
MLDFALCDEDPAQLALAADYTKQRCICSNHPEALLTSCETQQYDLSILDIVMPMSPV